MLKIIGCLFVIISCSLCGFYFSSQKTRRIVCLGEIIRLINEIEISMKYSRKTTADMLHELCKNSFEEIGFLSEVSIKEKTFFESFKELVEKNAPPLTDDDKKLLLSFAGELGSTDSEGQIKSAALYKSFFEKRLDGAKGECERQSRLYSSLGVLSGVFISILLV